MDGTAGDWQSAAEDVISLDIKLRADMATTEQNEHQKHQTASAGQSNQQGRQDGMTVKPKGPPRPPIPRPYKVLRLRLEADVPLSTSRSAGASSRPRISKSTIDSSSSNDPQASSSLEFVNSTASANDAESSVRRRIRAHVAKKSHPSAAKTRNASVSKATAAKTGKRHDALRGPGKALKREEASQEAEPEEPDQNSFVVGRHNTILPGTYMSIIAQSRDAINRIVLDDDSRRLGITLDRVGCDIRRGIDHFIFMMYSQLSQFENRFAPSGVRDARMRLFIGFLLSDPALTLSVLLAAVSHKLQLAGSASRFPTELMVLHSFALSAINQAISDPGRATSDGLIFCVMNMATYEAFMGSKEAFQVHMNGLLKMVTMRGGLDKLGLGGMLEKTIKWCDLNCAGLFGGPMLFVSDGEGGKSPREELRADVVAFSAGLIKDEGSDLM